MSHQITFQPMRVLIDGYDSDGRLILADDQLAAVIVLLDAEHHAEDRGKWYLEAGFGKCAVNSGNAPLWSTPEEAGAWVQGRLARSGRDVR
jgi:hypothetical protein